MKFTRKFCIVIILIPSDINIFVATLIIEQIFYEYITLKLHIHKNIGNSNKTYFLVRAINIVEGIFTKKKGAKII